MCYTLLLLYNSHRYAYIRCPYNIRTSIALYDPNLLYDM